MKSNLKLRRIVARSIRFSPFLLLLLLMLIITLIDSSVFTANSIMQIFVQSAGNLVLALPVMVWLISGNMDMSASYGTSFYILVLGNALARFNNNLFVSLLVLWIVALLVGLFNGFFVGILQIPSFIVTLASMSILQGLILVTSASQAIVIDNPILRALGSGTFLGVPILLYYAAAITLIVWAVLRYTRFGANVYAIGSNINAARINGVNIARLQIKIFMFSAFFTSLSSIALAARVSLVSPSLGGTTFLLNSVAACIIGGTSSTGGKGNVPGTVCGAIIIGMITFTMTALGVDSNSVNMLQGLIIIAALTIDTILNRIRVNLERNLPIEGQKA